jgi:preprotein translocase subunit SecF
MEKLLKFLSGKKSTIATILSLILWYVFAKGYIDDMAFAMLWGILTALFGTVSFATKKVYNK